MKYNQIAEILNDVYQEQIGESDIIAEDLSNIVDVGVKITSDTTFENNFDCVFKKIIDKVGKVVFHDDTFKSRHLPILRDAWEFGSIMEKIRTDVSDYSEDKSFDLASYTGDDVFTLSLPSVSAKYWNKKVSYRLKITMISMQLKSAFNSAADMSRFFASIENRVKMKLDMAIVALEYRLVANMVGEKFKSGNNLVNLYELYVAETGDTTTNFDTILTSSEFFRSANKNMGLIAELMEKPSMLYNDGGWVNITNPEDRVVLLLSDYEKGINNYLYATNRHNEFITENNYKTIPSWQSGGTDDSYDNRSSIDVIPASEGEAPTSGSDERLEIKETGLMGIMFDKRACAVCCEHSETRSIEVPDARVTNYWHFRDAEYISDLDENVVVFYISPYKRLGKLATAPADFGSSYYKKDGYEYVAVGASEAFSTSTVYFKKIS